MKRSISVILYAPEHPGNIGAVARAMKNFGFTELVLIQPQCDHLCDEARNRAKHAREVLEQARVGGPELLDEFDMLIATSGKTGGEYNIPRLALTPAQLHERLVDRSGSMGLVFGRESAGLTNEELAKADFLVTIPTNPDYPVLNLSHAVTVLLFALSELPAEGHPLARVRQKQEIYRLIDDLLEKMEFATPDKRETQRVLWHRVIGTGFLTSREAQAMLGFFKKVGPK